MPTFGSSRGPCDHADVNGGNGSQGAHEACILRRKCGLSKIAGLTTRDEPYAKFGQLYGSFQSSIGGQNF